MQLIGYQNLDAAVDPLGSLAVVWNTDQNTIYVSRLLVRSSSGAWSLLEKLPVSILADLTYDRYGRLTLLGKASGSCVYIQSRLVGGWQAPVTLDTSSECLPSLTYDSNDFLHLLLPNYPYLNYQGTRLSDQAKSALPETGCQYSCQCPSTDAFLDLYHVQPWQRRFSLQG